MSCNMIFQQGRALLLVAIVMSLGVSSASAQVFDDFSDLNDTANPTWTHLSGLVASSGQGWNAATGQYNLTAPNNGAAQGSLGQLGFVGSYVGANMTNSIVTADFVQSATGVGYGVASRLNGNNGIVALTGYAYVYEPFAANGQGEMVLYRIDPVSVITDIGSQQVTLDVANKDYTFSLEIVGSQLRGRVYEIGGGLVADKSATDATYASGFPGLFGYSGSGAGVTTNFTVDNFTARVPEPASASLLAAAGLGLLATRRGVRR
jgi:hypothetical protein